MDQTHRETETTKNSAYRSWSRTGKSSALAATNGRALSLTTLGRANRGARALGWLSVGLGLGQLIAPRQVGRLIGLGSNRRRSLTMRAIGLRGLTSGIGLLVRPRPTGWLWTRVVGDAVDLFLLGNALGARKVDRTRVPLAMASVAGVAILDVLTSRALTRADRQGIPLPEERAAEVKAAITVGRPPEEAYRLWRNFRNLPRFMTFIESVEVIDDRRSRWKTQAVKGKSLQWEGEITADQPNERIAWRAGPGSELPNQGEVRFRRAPGGRGTEVVLAMTVQPPGGVLGVALANLLKAVPQIKLSQDLRRFKQVLELGEVIESDASIHRGPHPARPAADDNEK